MKKFIVGAAALTLILCGCSENIPENGEVSVTSEASVSSSTAESASEGVSKADEAAKSVKEKSDDNADKASSASSASSIDAAAGSASASNAATSGISSNNVNTPAQPGAQNSAQPTAQNNTQAGAQNSAQPATQNNTQAGAQNNAQPAAQSNATLPFGVYATTIHTIEGGLKTEYKYFYSFHKDGTGTYYSCEEKGDVLGIFKFNDKTLTTANGAVYEYKLTGDHLRIELPNGGGEFDRIPDGDFVTNGDFWEFAGDYAATDNTNKSYGGGDMVAGIELDAGGLITGGAPLFMKENDAFPGVYPYEIVKNADGSYRCHLQYTDEAAQSYYEIYPKGVLAEADKNSPELKDVVYIRAYLMDGGVYNPIFVKKDN